MLYIYRAHHIKYTETLPSACYTVFNEISIPFYSTSNWYNN